MEKSILIAADDSVYSRYAVDYASLMYPLIKDLTFTLYHSQPVISHYILEEAKRTASGKKALEKLLKQNAALADLLLEALKKRLTTKGIDPSDVKTEAKPRQSGLAKDIITHSEEGLFDALVVGRRGVGLIQKLITGSVSSSILENTRVTPLWMVDGEVSSQVVTAAVDGSESSLRAIDHLSFMFSGNTDITVRILTVDAGNQDYCPINFDEADEDVKDLIIKGSNRCVEQFFAHAEKTIENNGMPLDRVEFVRVPKSGSIGATILKETRKYNTGTLVIGRSGVNKSFFLGGVSQYIIDNFKNMAVWVVM